MPGDDPVMCGLCDKRTSLAMIAHHLINEHGIDPDEIANAPVYDMTPFQREPTIYPEGSGYVEPGTEPGDLVGTGLKREQLAIEEVQRQLHAQLSAWRVPRNASTGGTLSLLARVRLLRNTTLEIVNAQRFEIDRLTRLLKEAGVDPRA